MSEQILLPIQLSWWRVSTCSRFRQLNAMERQQFKSNILDSISDKNNFSPRAKFKVIWYYYNRNAPLKIIKCIYFPILQRSSITSVVFCWTSKLGPDTIANTVILMKCASILSIQVAKWAYLWQFKPNILSSTFHQNIF